MLHYSSPGRRWFALALIVGVALFCGWEPVAAQEEYRSIPTNPDVERNVSAIRIAKGRVFNSSVQLTDAVEGPLADRYQNYRDVLDAWYTGWLLPRFTQAESEDPAELRQELNRDLRSCRSDAAHAHIVDLLRRAMTRICEMDYHPAVRYNAMLMLGDLNSSEVADGGRTPPVPLLSALTVMIDQYEKPEQIDAVRVAALVGILRHAELAPYRPATQPMPEAGKDRIVEMLLPLMQAADPLEGRSAEGHYWMQRRGAEILGALGKPGPDNVVITILAGMMGNEDRPLALRCTAAEALARFDMSTTGLDPNAALADLGAVAADAVIAELEILDAWQTQREQESDSFDNRFDIGPAAGGFGEAVEWDPDVEMQMDALRRQLKSRLLCVQRALNGPDTRYDGFAAIAATPDQQVLVTSLDDAIEQLLEAADTLVDDEEAGSLEKLLAIRDAVQTRGRVLAQMVDAARAAATPAATPPEEEPTDNGLGLPGEETTPPEEAAPDLPGSDLPG